MKQLLLLTLVSFVSICALCQETGDKPQVMAVVHRFFETLESQDSLAFRNLHMEGARFYIAGEKNDTVRTAVRGVTDFTFTKNQLIKERMRDTGVVVQVHDKIAMVWAPYDLWVNETFSHCGVDVFTLLKTATGWKIASCSYTIETRGCK